MKLQPPKEDWNNQVPTPPISYKPGKTIGKTPTEKLDYLKVDIKTQPGERDSETVAIYMTLLWTGSLEALLKFFTILHKIIRGQDLSMGPQKFGMKWNLVARESLQVFEQKARERGTETNKNYELVMKDLISHFPLLKVINNQKRYLRRELYKPRGTKTRYFICRINEMVKYLKKFLPFSSG